MVGRTLTQPQACILALDSKLFAPFLQDISARSGCDAGSMDQWLPANGVVYLMDASKEPTSQDWAYLSAVRSACQVHGGVPLVLGLSFQDKVAKKKQDISKLVRQCEQLLPKTVFFPLALTEGADMCGAVCKVTRCSCS